MDRLTAWLVSTGDDGRVSRRIWSGAVLVMTLSTCTGMVSSGMGVSEAPLAPSGASASALSAADILLTWMDNSANETDFIVERASSSSGPFVTIGTVDANTTSYDDGGLSPSTTYYYRVRATNAAGSSSASDVVSASTQPVATNPPVAPSNLAATAQSSSAIRLTWTTNSNNQTGFSLERSRSSSSGFTEVATPAANVTSSYDYGLFASTTYYYRLRAKNGAGYSTYSNIASATTLAPATSPPAAPSNLAATAQSSSSIRVTWTTNSSNQTGFSLERSLSSSSGFTEVAKPAASATSYSDSGRSASTTYYYRLRAVNEAGYSGYSSVASATTQSAPPPPTDVASALAVLAQRAIFFDHASVGGNILVGVQALLDANSGSEPALVPTTSPGSIQAGVWAEYGWYDLNTHPFNKVTQFRGHMNDGGIGAKVDLAFMKFCFIDFDSGGDSVKTEEEAAALFTAYQSMAAAVEASNPDVKLIHFTAPLVAAGNARREAYNGRIRNAYSSTGRVFDLADIESNGHTDSDGRVLDPDYDSGDGHLNDTGKAVVARALVLFLANLP